MTLCHRSAARLLLAAALALSFNGCLGNPFGGEDKIRDQRQVQGRVVFSNGAAAAGVFVWLDRYDRSTRTDSDGSFLLALPPLQNRQGVVEEGTLYFYLANCKLVTAAVKIVEGQFAYGEAGIDRDGKLRDPVVMVRVVNIMTWVEPAVWPAEEDSLRIVVGLVTDSGCALVYNPLIDSVPPDGVDFAPLGAVLLRQLQTGQVFTLRSTPTGNGTERLMPCFDDSVHRQLLVEGTQLRPLPAGKYEVIPYLWLEPEGTPAALLANLGPAVNELGASYLKKPMQRQAAILEIRQPLSP
ncbi:MAG: carboxypeptidase-like regulatory domain-containing protein [candidate division KSB1 bacterium]|nr:carboxypeptidase-like regulatory domain-containing protein [candidate division KSB1 bacterium]MDZ7274824.1 carboxypeptidase-like regulatory domain-containing protein [candidate division KSB1 bacterium]MDZ7285649.1 carboxypeptidase-like regulatory domain-containing protein [candidate division KSB1 bacterium]MDZ7298681.1 carboxypeptidase-like regulatory domain-containing protein [candidate division KSB1 bacterium]MDZ7308411.1 carboxypeptidase-like regulatory domain-containing protein [candidat